MDLILENAYLLTAPTPPTTTTPTAPTTTPIAQLDQSQDKCSIRIKRTRINNKSCIVCRSSSNKLHVISKAARIDAFIETNILIDPKCRACSFHFESFHKESRLTSQSLQQIEVFDDTSNLESDELLDILESVQHIAKFNSFAYRFSDYNRIVSNECEKLLGKESLILLYYYFIFI